MTTSETPMPHTTAPMMLSPAEQRLVRTLHERLRALLEVSHGLEHARAEMLGERLVTLDELRLDPLGPVHVRSPELELLRERFDALREGIPDGSAVVEARDALQALQASVAPASDAALELAESLESAAVALARAHGEPGRAAQDAFDDLAARLRDGATPQSLTVLRETVDAALEALTAHTVHAALRALHGAPALAQDLLGLLHGEVSGERLPTAPQVLEPVNAGAAQPAAGSAVAMPMAPSVKSSAPEPVPREVPGKPGASEWGLRDWLAEDAKQLSDEVLDSLFDPGLVKQARERGIAPSDVRRTRSLLRTVARTAGQNAQRIDLAIALEALVVSDVAPGTLPDPGAVAGARKPRA